ncbi:MULTISPECIES: ribonuclease P protein subunit [Pyrobaculum]|uniref:Uncharacterized protein n=2 Tax=Pyrobaculum arsenaticum TaxID=121277 RepID=A4WIY6_PYRAR|nr:ribonuclease P protein subunit [Pyrobaculum arsenaticum]ABP50353.1 conserved hypothetical protein [Pyrobaculum arsenaticum DSM 13514]MCY0890339.1 ribonuclease P protein subunit [Pyrobaculum arsenaticum]NYR14703.1 hypothetical protein [Pyrobaculum arsenaticum]
MLCVDLLGKVVSTYRCSYKLRGVVIGETYNTFLIFTGSRVATVPKSVCRFFIHDDGLLVNGIYLVGYRDVRLFNCGKF